MQVPHCTRCGREHYRFVACGNVDVWNERHAENKAKAAGPKVENWRVPDGYREVTLGKPNTASIARLPTPAGFHTRGMSNGPEAA
jgi:hypothetical protein